MVQFGYIGAMACGAVCLYRNDGWCCSLVISHRWLVVQLFYIGFLSGGSVFFYRCDVVVVFGLYLGAVWCVCFVAWGLRGE